MKFKKTIFMILALICVSVSCFGCENSDKNRKYDIRIRLRSNLGDVVTFELGEDKKRMNLNIPAKKCIFGSTLIIYPIIRVGVISGLLRPNRVETEYIKVHYIANRVV